MTRVISWWLIAILVVASGLVQAQDRLGDGLHQAEIISWDSNGEWTTRKDGNQTYLTTGSKESRLATPVIGAWLTIYRHAEYGGGEMFVGIDGCVQLVKSTSVHDGASPVAFPLEGPQLLIIQSGEGRVGIDAIRISKEKPSNAVAQWNESNPCAHAEERRLQAEHAAEQRRLNDQKRIDDINARAQPCWNLFICGAGGFTVLGLIAIVLEGIKEGQQSKKKREETGDLS